MVQQSNGTDKMFKVIAETIWIVQNNLYEEHEKQYIEQNLLVYLTRHFIYYSNRNLCVIVSNVIKPFREHGQNF